MSLVQTCVDTEAAIARARALFGSPGSVDVPNSSAEITSAIHTATAARDRTADMAGGAGMPAYREMVERGFLPLATGASSDAALTTQVTTAAAVSTAGAQRLDALAVQARAITLAAAAARSAADQRAIVTALRNQIAQVQQVVQSTQLQAGAAATQIRALRYPKDAPVASDRAQAGPMPRNGPGDIWDPSTAYKLFNSMNECEAWITFRKVLYPWQQWECHIAGPGGVAGSFIVEQA
jgi:hypothetical protein